MKYYYSYLWTLRSVAKCQFVMNPVINKEIVILDYKIWKIIM